MGSTTTPWPMKRRSKSATRDDRPLRCQRHRWMIERTFA